MKAMFLTWPTSTSEQNKKKVSETKHRMLRNASPHGRRATQKLLLGIGEKKQRESEGSDTLWAGEACHDGVAGKSVQTEDNERNVQ